MMIRAQSSCCFWRNSSSEQSLFLNQDEKEPFRSYKDGDELWPSLSKPVTADGLNIWFCLSPESKGSLPQY